MEVTSSGIVISVSSPCRITSGASEEPAASEGCCTVTRADTEPVVLEAVIVKYTFLASAVLLDEAENIIPSDEISAAHQFPEASDISQFQLEDTANSAEAPAAGKIISADVPSDDTVTPAEEEDSDISGTGTTVSVQAENTDIVNATIKYIVFFIFLSF